MAKKIKLSDIPPGGYAVDEIPPGGFEKDILPPGGFTSEPTPDILAHLAGLPHSKNYEDINLDNPSIIRSPTPEELSAPNVADKINIEESYLRSHAPFETKALAVTNELIRNSPVGLSARAIAGNNVLPENDTATMASFPAQSFGGKIAGEILTTIALGGVANPYLSKLAPKITSMVPMLNELYPTASRVIGGVIKDTILGSIVGFTKETAEQSATRDFSPGKIAKETAVTAASFAPFGVVPYTKIGIEGGISGTSKRGAAALGLVGSASIVASLINDGKINNDELVNIAVNSISAGLLQGMNARQISESYAGQEAEDFYHRRTFNKIKEAHPEMNDNEVNAIAAVVNNGIAKSPPAIIEKIDSAISPAKEGLKNLEKEHGIKINAEPESHQPPIAKIVEQALSNAKEPTTGLPASEIIPNVSVPLPEGKDMGVDTYYDSPRFTVYDQHQAQGPGGNKFVISEKGHGVVFGTDDVGEAVRRAQELDKNIPPETIAGGITPTQGTNPPLNPTTAASEQQVPPLSPAPSEAAPSLSQEDFDAIAATVQHGSKVTARVDISDNPLSKNNESAKKGEVGEVVDVDHANRLLYVQFGNKEAIPVSIDELSETHSQIKSTPSEPSTEEINQSFEAAKKDAAMSDKIRSVEASTHINDILNTISSIENPVLPEMPTKAMYGEIRNKMIQSKIGGLKKDIVAFAREYLPAEQAAKIADRIKYSNSMAAVKAIAAQAKTMYEGLSKVPQTESTKATINRTTGLTPVNKVVEVPEKQGLKEQIRLEQQASKEGFKEGKQITKEDMVKKIADAEARVESIVEFVKNTLPKSEQGRVLRLAARAKTERRQIRVLRVVRDIMAKIETKKLEDAIKEFKNIPDNIDVKYQKEMMDIMDSIDLSKPMEETLKRLNSLNDYIKKTGQNPVGISQKTLDELKRLSRRALKSLSDNEKSDLLDKLNILKEHGKLMRRMRIEEFKNRVQNRRKRILASTKNLDPKGEVGSRQYNVKKEALLTYLYTQTPPFVANYQDGHQDLKGPNVEVNKELTWREDNAEFDGFNESDDAEKTILAIKKTYEPSEMAALAYELYRNQIGQDTRILQTLAANGFASVSKDGKFTLKKNVIVTPEIKLIAEKMKAAVSKHQYEEAAIWEFIHNEPFEFVKNYFPIRALGESHFTDPLDAIRQSPKRAKTHVDEGAYMKRDPNAKGLIDLNVFDVMRRRIMDGARFRHLAPALHELSHVFINKDYSKAAGEINTHLWTKMIEVIANNGWAPGAETSTIQRNLRVVLGDTVIAGKVTSALIQPFQAAIAMGWSASHFPTGTSAKIIKQVLINLTQIDSKGTREYIKNSKALSLREGTSSAGDVSLAEIMEASKIREKWRNKVREVFIAPLKYGDLNTAAAVQKVIEDILIKDKIPNSKREAEYFMHLLSASSNVAQRPLILSKGEMYRTFTTFQSFAMAQWSVVSEGLIHDGILNSKNLSKKFMSMLGLSIIVAGDIFVTLMKAWFWENVTKSKTKIKTNKDFIKLAALSIPSMIPIFGSIIESAAEGFEGRSLFPAEKVLEDISFGTAGMFTRKTPKAKMRSGLRAAQAALTIGGTYEPMLAPPGMGQAFDFLRGSLNEKNSAASYPFGKQQKSGFKNF